MATTLDAGRWTAPAPPAVGWPCLIMVVCTRAFEEYGKVRGKKELFDRGGLISCVLCTTCMPTRRSSVEAHAEDG